MSIYLGLTFKKVDNVLFISYGNGDGDRYWILDMNNGFINLERIEKEWTCTFFRIKHNGDKFTFFSRDGKKLVSYRI